MNDVARPAEIEMPHTLEGLHVEGLERGCFHRFWVGLAQDAAGRPMGVPLLVARGSADGPVVGITAALHGNELNGIPIIHRLFARLVPTELRGTVVAVPISNVPGYRYNIRAFADGVDLNRIMPGRADGTFSDVYAHSLVNRIVRHFEYLIDLHTASFGRANCLYVRADMGSEVVAKMARVVRPQIIVDNPRRDGTLRGAAFDMGIPSITLEVGDPHLFQGGLIVESGQGIDALLAHLGMIPVPPPVPEPRDAIECSHSYWIYTDAGGLLDVECRLVQRLTAGEPVAKLYSVFGDVKRTYVAPEDGVVIGKSTNPAANSGARILHLGVVRK